MKKYIVWTILTCLMAGCTAVHNRPVPSISRDEKGDWLLWYGEKIVAVGDSTTIDSLYFNTDL